jgi:enoyl-[acyl-carrier protein] reductase/trans-2-enoyl-CoA reductase (NAD+)
MIVKPKIRGFICTTSHPEGCTQQVQEQIDYIKEHPPITNGPKKVLVIGASTGYGLSSRIAAAFGCGADTFGVFFEKPPSEDKTASPGWYNSAALEETALQQGLKAASINGDAFSDEIKEQTINQLKNNFGPVDLVIYSLASPRRTDPQNGNVYRSTLKPIGKAYTNKNLNTSTGQVTKVTIQPANEQEIHDTGKVMGGEDWELWIDALKDAELLTRNFITVAYSYIGPELTWPIYKNGTIGKAKESLEKSAADLNQRISDIDGNAYVSVNKAVVTQASSAIPVVPLYISILFKIMKRQGTHEGCIEQIHRLFADHFYSGKPIQTDDRGRIRVDDLEMHESVQSEIGTTWQKIHSDNMNEFADLQGYREEFHKLFGFGMNGIDYEKDVKVDIGIPSLK